MAYNELKCFCIGQLRRQGKIKRRKFFILTFILSLDIVIPGKDEMFFHPLCSRDVPVVIIIEDIAIKDTKECKSYKAVAERKRSFISNKTWNIDF